MTKQQSTPKQQEEDTGRFSLEFGELKPFVAQIAHRNDRSMNYVVCAILNNYLKVNEPGFKETKKYRID